MAVTSSFLLMEIGVHLIAVIALKIRNGVNKSCHKESKYAQLSHCLKRDVVFCGDSSGLTITEQCSFLLVSLTIPASGIRQRMCWLHWLLTTTKDFLVSSHTQLRVNMQNTYHSSGWSALRSELWVLCHSRMDLVAE